MELAAIALVAALVALAVGVSERQAGAGTILVNDDRLNDLLAPDAAIEVVAEGFRFTEGPVWSRDGALLFSDIPANTIFRWDPRTRHVTAYRQPSGNSNGLTLDREGRVVACEHTGRRVSREAADGEWVTLADRYEGKRLNSPNDLVYRSDGGLYFTDPPYGLPRLEEDPARELPFCGVYRRDPDGTLHLLTRDLLRPNGLAFSPDERTLYIADSSDRKHVRAFAVAEDGTLVGEGPVFADMQPAFAAGTPGSPDGMKVDRQGNLWSTGPGGVWVFTPAGEHLGTIRPPEIPANCAWGDEDGGTLYMTARTRIYRIRTRVMGIRP